MRNPIKNLILFLGSITVTFSLIEFGYRIIDPSPHFTPAEVNATEHGNLSQYDSEIGWSGVACAQEQFTTVNASVMLQHNCLGYRDIEPESRSEDKPAIVFIGDSFTWGYEVEWDEMFVNRLRDSLPDYEVYNLGHRGYGTDQSLLTFRRWQATNDRPVDFVVLMFSGNDIGDNNSRIRYKKQKPAFEIRDDELVLSNVPVSRSDNWQTEESSEPEGPGLKQQLKSFPLRSRFLYDVTFRIKQFQQALAKKDQRATRAVNGAARQPQDITVTKRILQSLEDDVTTNGAKLIVFAIPSKTQFMEGNDSVAYQKRVEELCQALGIPFVDLAPAYQASVSRSYFKRGLHWNAHGHKLAADSILHYLTRGRLQRDDK